MSAVRPTDKSVKTISYLMEACYRPLNDLMALGRHPFINSVFQRKFSSLIIKRFRHASLLIKSDIDSDKLTSKFKQYRTRENDNFSEHFPIYHSFIS